MKHRYAWIDPEAAQAALKVGRGRGIKIAVLDSGIELSHPTLRHLRLVDDIAFTLRPESRTVARTPGGGIDAWGHGTAVASVIHRIAPEAQIGNFRILDEHGSSVKEIIERAARLAVDRGYHILNLSIGSPCKVDIKFYKPWIDEAYRHGVHVVSACSNKDFRTPEWPGQFPSVITVNMAKIESDDLLFRWDTALPSSDYPHHLVEFAARGVDVEVAWKGGKTKKESGSSFAAPHVSGLLARLLSEYPNLKPPVAKALLQEAARPWEPAFKTSNF